MIRQRSLSITPMRMVDTERKRKKKRSSEERRRGTKGRMILISREFSFYCKPATFGVGERKKAFAIVLGGTFRPEN